VIPISLWVEAEIQTKTLPTGAPALRATDANDLLSAGRGAIATICAIKRTQSLRRLVKLDRGFR